MAELVDFVADKPDGASIGPRHPAIMPLVGNLHKGGPQRHFRFSVRPLLPLDVTLLNERLYEVGLWLIDRHIPHQARVLCEPNHRRIRVTIPMRTMRGISAPALVFPALIVASKTYQFFLRPAGHELAGRLPPVSGEALTLRDAALLN